MANWILDPEGESFEPDMGEKAAADARRAMDAMTQKSDALGAQERVQRQGDSNQWVLEPEVKDYSQANPTIMGNQVPPHWRPVVQRMTDIATGANETLAGALGMPAAAVANLMNSVLAPDHQFFQGNMTSGDMKTMIQNGLRSIPGMGADKSQAFDQWWADVGEKAGTQALMTIAMLAGSGPLAALGKAASPNSVAGAVAKNVGELGVAHPGQVIAADAGATALGTAAPQADEFLKGLGINSNPAMLELLGTLAGGPLGAGLASMAKLRPQIPGGKQGLFDKFGGMPKLGGRQLRDMPIGNALLETKGFSSEDVTKAITGYTKTVLDDTQKRIAQITLDNNDPARTAGAVRGVIKQASTKAKAIRDQIWAPVDMKRPVPVADAVKAAKEVLLSASDPSVRVRTIPVDFANDIVKWAKKYKGGNIPMSEMRKMAAAISDDAVNLGLAGTSGPPSDTLRANLTKMAVSINDSMAKAYPNDLALAKAKEYSTWYHDTFSRGPVGEFGQVRLNEGYQASAKNTLPTAMGDERFAEQLAKTGQVTGMTKEIEGRSADYLRSVVADAYRTGQPPFPGLDPQIALAQQTVAAKQAARAMQDPDFIRWQQAFPKQDKIFQQHLTDLQDEIGKADQIQHSMFFNKAGTDPEKAVESLFNSGTKVKDAKMIMETIGGDDNAIKAIKNSLIEKLGSSVNWDPTQMAARLASKDMQQMLGIFMGPQDLGRLKRLLATGMEVQSGVDAKGSLSPALLGGRVIGSMLARAGGIHTIQGTSVGAKIGGSLLERLFHVVPPDKLVARALVDPNWEKFLLSKVPDNMQNFRRTSTLLGLAVGSIEAGHRKLMQNEEEKR